MTKGVEYRVLKPLDIVLTGGNSWFAGITKIVTGGMKKFGKRDFATHAGIIIDIHGQKFIAEMRGPGKRSLEINSLEEYVNDRGRWIVDIKRYKGVITSEQEEATQKAIARDYRKGIDYDPIGGLAEFVFKNVKDHPEKKICSEYVYEALRSHAGVDFPERYKERVHPRDLQLDDNFKSVIGGEKKCTENLSNRNPNY